MIQETKFCIYCGKKIPADVSICPYCGKQLSQIPESQNTEQDNVQENIPQNEAYVSKERSYTTPERNYPVNSQQYSNVLPIRRLLLLMILTGGLYRFYWYYKNSKMLKQEFNEDHSPGLMTILLFIPIANWVVFYDLIDKWRNAISSKGLETYSSGINLVIWILTGMHFWVIINIQESINEYWRLKQPNLPIHRNFTNNEKILIGIIIAIIIVISIILVAIIIIAGMSTTYPSTYY
ncbi:zinc ribbon domain-containing protein [Methanobrevibacter curvatus]|uniref:Zinc-ribbon domain-containing protein n=1 Tax=Methanobrevibacter curvatus TaxID=49547 RepID=A0A166D644_9EURY|nr:zinc ribbon domain-containing protein [Methanobrevibacter curvatus]KZX15245.1 hypothetical protein MBCUR_03050 [Methanobrevibacter curvatus]